MTVSCLTDDDDVDAAGIESVEDDIEERGSL